MQWVKKSSIHKFINQYLPTTIAILLHVNYDIFSLLFMFVTLLPLLIVLISFFESFSRCLKYDTKASVADFLYVNKKENLSKVLTRLILKLEMKTFSYYTLLEFELI